MYVVVPEGFVLILKVLGARASRPLDFPVIEAAAKKRSFFAFPSG
jgi:hypothetical protein